MRELRQRFFTRPLSWRKKLGQSESYLTRSRLLPVPFSIRQRAYIVVSSLQPQRHGFVRRARCFFFLSPTSLTLNQHQQAKRAEEPWPGFVEWNTFNKDITAPERYVCLNSQGTLIFDDATGIHSTNTDERCITYCSQTVAGRHFRRDPWCRSICIRKVFSHEVRNIISIKTHSNTTPDGRTKYPLPAEGQRPLPWWSGDGAEGDEKSSHQKKMWEEGLYVWVSKSRFGINEKLDLMTMNLEKQAKWEMVKEKRKKEWETEEEKAKRHGRSSTSTPNPDPPSSSSHPERSLPSQPPPTSNIIRRPFPHNP